jgi:hypothetical protein
MIPSTAFQRSSFEPVFSISVPSPPYWLAVTCKRDLPVADGKFIIFIPVGKASRITCEYK